MRPRTVVVAVVLLVIVVGAFTVAGVALLGRFHQTDRHRAADLATWHDAVCFLERKSIRPSMSPAERVRLYRFYDGLLIQIHAQPCTHPNGGSP